MSHPAAAMDLGARRWTELGHGHQRWLLAVPVGSCEQHGPHLPLDTDTLIAVSLAESLARRRDDTLVAPAIGIGASGEHASFPGTLSIGTEALTDVLVELARSALPDPTGTATTDLTTADLFSAVLFVNGHGGNVDALERARSLLGLESRRVDVWHPRCMEGIPTRDTPRPHSCCSSTPTGWRMSRRGGIHCTLLRDRLPTDQRPTGRRVPQRCARRSHRGHRRGRGLSVRGAPRRPPRDRIEASGHMTTIS
ncbi:MAG: creatininase family protein [Microthrixaceae bacterium]